MFEQHLLDLTQAQIETAYSQTAWAMIEAGIRCR